MTDDPASPPLAPRVTLITLGVRDLPRSRAFYERLGWRASGASQEGVAFFQLGGLVLSLYGRDALATDAALDGAGSGFAGMSLAQNLPSREAVDAAYDAMVAAGATPLKAPHPIFWGGYCGFAADPDGFVWELAHNPFFPLDGNGNVVLPP